MTLLELEKTYVPVTEVHEVWAEHWLQVASSVCHMCGLKPEQHVADLRHPGTFVCGLTVHTEPAPRQ